MRNLKKIAAGFMALITFTGCILASLMEAGATTSTHYSSGNQTSDYSATDWYEDTKWGSMSSVVLSAKLSLKDITTYGKNYTDVYERNQGTGDFATPQRNDWRKLGFRSTSVRSIITGFNKIPEAGDHYSYWSSDPDFSYKPTAWLNHFYDDALKDNTTRLLYQKKIQVSYGQVISLVAATNDTADTGGSSLTGNNQFYWSVIELNELGEIVFDSSWMKTNETWTVGISTGGLNTPYGVSPDDRRIQVKYVIPVMRWDNGNSSIGSGGRQIKASSVNRAYSVFYMVGSPFTYTFYKNDGTSESWTRTRTGLSGLNESVPVPTKAGYDFKGWRVSESSGGKQTGKVYSAETLQSMINNGDYWSSLFGDAVFTAQWERSKVNLTVNGDEGIASTSPSGTTSVTMGSSIAVSASVKNGYSFDGWFIGSTKISGSTSFTYTMPESAVTLTAKTTKVTYTNTISHWMTGFKYGEGNNGLKNCFRIKDTSFSQPFGAVYTLGESNRVTIPNGFELKQLYSSGSISSDGSWSEYAFSTQITQKAGTMHFEYFYQPIQYKINYDLNYDTDTTSIPVNNPNNPLNYDILYGVTLSAPERKGYNFDGWYDKSDNKVTGINEGCNANFSNADDMYIKLNNRTGEDKVFTAKWTPRSDTKYTVRHWKQKLYLDNTTTYAGTEENETNYECVNTDTKTFEGTTDSIVTVYTSSDKYEGFTAKTTEVKVKIKGDGTAVVDFYYTRNTYSITTDNSDTDSKDKENGIESGNGIDPEKTKATSQTTDNKTDKRTFKYEEIVTVTTDTLSGYHWHIDGECECYTRKQDLYETKWSPVGDDYGVEKWVTEDSKTYGYKDQTTKFYMPAHDVKLRADATNNSYTINFYPNKPSNVINPITGAVSTATSEVSPNTVISKQYIYNHAGQVLPIFSLRGWIFEGWSKTITYNNNYGADNRNTRYNLLFPYNTDNNTWSNINALPIMTTKNLDVINLYAKWEATVDEIALNYGHSASTNPFGDLRYREQEENDTKLTKNGPDKIRLTYDARMSDSPELKNLNPSGLPIPTLTGAESTGWVNNKGSICNNETIYTGLENKMLYITWRQLAGTFTYNANGITYNNNGIGASIEKKSGSENINVMTEDITLKDNMFGIKNNDTTYNNYTQGDKYGYAVLKDGKSYTSITDTKNQTAYYSFQGWSANKYATVVGDNNAGLIHQPGYFNRLYRYVYETIAANKLNNKNTEFNLSTVIPDEIRSNVDTMILNKGLGIEADQTNLNAVMYAVWDQFPTISTNVVNIPISVLETYLDKNTYTFNNEVNDKIKEFIKANLEVTDREDGDLKNSLEFDGVDDIIEIVTDMYKNPEKTSNTITTRIHVSDSVDNTTYAYVKVVLISNKAKQNEPVIPAAEYDDKLSKISGVRIDSTRIITKKFYNASYENGGLIPNSIWKNNSDYKEAIETCFENFEKNTPEETWLFTHSTIKEFRDNFNPEKTTSSLNEFYEKYKSCKIK